MDFSATVNHDAVAEDFRLTIMFVLLVIGAGIAWLALRRIRQSEKSPLTASQRLRRVFIVGGVGLLFLGLNALVYYSNGPLERVPVSSGKPLAIGFLPFSRWGFGVSNLEILDQRSEREAGCSSEIEGLRFRFGFVEYRAFDWPPPCVE